MIPQLLWVDTFDLFWEEALSKAHPEDLPHILRFQQHDDQRDRVVGRALLRFFAGASLGTSPHEVAITIADSGQPQIDGLHFSLSHCPGRVVLAIDETPIGVDVEHRDRSVDIARIVDRFFTPPERSIIGNDRSMFFHFWTRKEAILKAVGKGLTVPLKHVDVRDEVATVNGQTFYLTTVITEEGFIVSWACKLRRRLSPILAVGDATLTNWACVSQ